MTAFKTLFLYLSSILLLLVLTSCSSRSDKRIKQAQLHLGAGTQALMTKDYTQALVSLLKANELDPENPAIINNLGMAYYFKGEEDLAIKTLYQSLKLDDKNSDARLNLASIFFNQGDLVKSEKMYLSVLKDLTYDKQARTYYNLGILEIKRGRENLASGYFSKSIKEDENYCPSHLQLGMIHYKHQRFNQALKNFKDATMGVCYESAPAHYYQGLTYMGLKRFNEARLKFDEVDARFKSSPFAREARAKMMELTEIDKNQLPASIQAKGKLMESPEF